MSGELITQAAPEPETDAASEITVSEEGEVSFGEDYFKDLAPRDEPEQEPARETAEPEADTGETTGEPAPEPSPMSEYTVNDLNGLDFEKIDRARIPDAVKAYLPSLDAYHQRQTQRFEAEKAALAQRVAELEAAVNPEANKRYIDTLEVLDADAVTEAAKQRAAERLKIAPEELDPYDPRQMTAISSEVASLTMRNERNAEARRQYERDVQDYNVFCRRVAELPDFAEFDKHVTENLAKTGVTAEQLKAHVVRTGGVKELMSAMVKEYGNFKAAKQKPSVPAPPKLESAAGNLPTAKREIDLQKFGDLDPDAQARALLEGGYI